MKRRRRLGFALCCSVLGLAATVGAQGNERIISRQHAGSDIEILDLKTSPDGSVSATLKNNTNTIMRDVTLLVMHTWYWKNERHPGDDSPGRSTYVAVPGEIPPGGTVPFQHRANPPLPNRSDGTFQTTLSVQGFTQVGD